LVFDSWWTCDGKNSLEFECTVAVMHGSSSWMLGGGRWALQDLPCYSLVNLRTFCLRFIQIYLKLSPLMGNYLAKQESFLCEKLSCWERKVPWWEIVLQSKKGSLMRNYLAEQEKYKFYYLKSNLLMWNYPTEQEKNSIHAINHW
jgi:hypothetical protein